MMQSYNILCTFAVPEMLNHMRTLKFLLPSVLGLTLLIACNKELKVNADWKDITVVYGLLDQNEDTTFIKITKAFLGPGDALQFAKIPDSSNYPDKLDVRIEEWNGTTLKNSYACDTVTIHNKKAGDSIFYFPDQLMYYTLAPLNENYQYKLRILNKKTGKEITSQTSLVHNFQIEKPLPFIEMNFQPGLNNQVQWITAVGGSRYQMDIRFHYREALIADTSQKVEKYIDWIVFNNVKPINNLGGQTISNYYPGDGFYNIAGSKIPVNPYVKRTALFVDVILSVASDDLNTYMEVTEPSYTIVQERPTFTNITNGIGLFASRFNNVIDSLRLYPYTIAQLKVNDKTKDLGF